MTTKEKFLSALAITLIGAALYYAGQSDYVDDKIIEMKNNGSYERLWQPNLSDSDLVKIYENEQSSND